MANTIRIKRRISGPAGAPSSLENAELAFNEVDSILYYGQGTGGVGGSATSILAIAGPGAFATLSSIQTISGQKTFSGTVDFSGTATAVTQAASDDSTKIATTAFVKAQSFGAGTVTSVGLSLPNIFSVTNSPVTSSGTLSATLTSQTQNTIFAAPNGSNGAPSFRSLVAGDIPSLTASKISDFDTQVRTNRLDQLAVPTAPVSFNNQRITDLAAPLLPTDAATKQYADSIAQSLNVHGAADYATTGSVSYAYTSGGTALTITEITGTDTITFSANHNLAINSQVRTGDTTTGTGLTANTTYYVTAIPALDKVKVSSTYGGSNATLTNGTGLSIGVTGDPGVGATLSGCPNSVDSGSTLTVGQRVFIKDHTTSAYNGVYRVTTVGSGSNGVWTRSSDFDNGPTGEITSGDYIFVASGTVNGGNGFVQTSPPPIRMGISGAGYSSFTGDPITFTQFSGAGQITAGAGLTKSGNTIDVVSTGSGSLTITADSINLTSGIATPGTYQSVTVDTYGRVTAGTNPTTLAGYGITDAQPLDATLTALAGVTVAADQVIYSTAADAFTVTSLTSFGRSLIGAIDAPAARTTLGLGSMATQNANSVAITGGTIDGVTIDGGSF